MDLPLQAEASESHDSAFATAQKCALQQVSLKGLGAFVDALQQASFKEDGQKALKQFHQWIQDGAGGAEGWILEEENHEGWRVSVEEGEGKQGWLLLRASLHDPLLVLNVESDIPSGGSSLTD